MSTRVVAPVVAAWFIGVAAAFGAVSRYQAPPVSGAATWPADSVMAPATGVVNVVLFVDSDAPAPRAKLGELAELAALRSDVQVHVVIVRPGAAPRDAGDALVERAAEIRGAQVFVDEGGQEARRFGAAVGTTLVYGRDGARQR